MVFSSSIFLFGFLPVVLLIYFVTPRPLRNSFLLFASLVFYAWGEKQYSLVLIGSILGNYFAGIWLAKSQSKWLLAAAVAGNMLVLVGFKYANFLQDNLNLILESIHLSPVMLFQDKVHLPIGVSFFTFQGVAYVVDVYTRVVPPAPNPVRYALYAALFPHLVAGPIVRYRDIADQLGDRRITLDQFTEGIRRLTIGLAKKLILANTVSQYADIVFKLPPHDLSPGIAWLGLICYTLQIYLDFSGYSDMAIGLGKMFGFTFLENFNYPYISRSITEFWRRWHISLSSWLRDYVYIPLGGSRVSPERTYFNLMLVFLLCGFWHGASWNFVVWGLWHGAFLVIERLFLGKVLDQTLPPLAPLKHIYALLIATLGWVFFRADTLSQAMQYLSALFGGGTSFFVLDDVWNREVALGLLLAIPACLPIVPWLKEQILHHGTRGWQPAQLEWLSSAACVALWPLVFICLCGSAHNPFIYFRF